MQNSPSQPQSRPSSQQAATPSGPLRRNRCKECPACTAPNCKKCHYCLDMKIYGGPGLKRKTCLLRKPCENVSSELCYKLKNNFAICVSAGIRYQPRPQIECSLNFSTICTLQNENIYKIVDFISKREY